MDIENEFWAMGINIDEAPNGVKSVTVPIGEIAAVLCVFMSHGIKPLTSYAKGMATLSW